MTQEHATDLQKGLNRLLKGDTSAFLEDTLCQALPDITVRLVDKQKLPAARKILEQTAAATRTVEKESRLGASACLVAIAGKLAGAAHWPLLDTILPALENICSSPVFSDRIRADAAKTVRMTRSRSTAPDQEKKSEPEAKDPLALREEQIFQLAAKGNIDVAKKQLFDLVVACARKKDFTNAERLRDRIYEIDPMALTEIIQSGEIIDEEKSEAISTDHLDVWKKLLKILTSEEFNALYHQMEERIFQPEEIIVSQGAKNDELFFINHGSVRVSHTGGGKELFFKNLGSGEIAGENFFNASIWTVTLTARQRTSVSVLKRNALAGLEQNLPGMESKLIDFYNRTSDLYTAMKKKGMDRRIHERYRLERKIQLQIVDDRDKILSSFRGVLADLSRGGLSFAVRITRKENSRLLLGRKIKVSVPVPGSTDRLLRGIVTGVQVFDLVMSDYSVHVRFDRELDRSQLNILIS